MFYLTLFYNRNELGFRIALYFGSAVLAAAFSGILAYGVFQIDNTRISGWQYLFIIECVSLLFRTAAITPGFVFTTCATY